MIIRRFFAYQATADFDKWQSPALFLSAATNAHGNGRLNHRVIDTVFNEVCGLVGVEGPPALPATPWAGTSP